MFVGRQSNYGEIFVVVTGMGHHFRESPERPEVAIHRRNLSLVILEAHVPDSFARTQTLSKPMAPTVLKEISQPRRNLPATPRRLRRMRPALLACLDRRRCPTAGSVSSILGLLLGEGLACKLEGSLEYPMNADKMAFHYGP